MYITKKLCENGGWKASRILLNWAKQSQSPVILHLTSSATQAVNTTATSTFIIPVAPGMSAMNDANLCQNATTGLDAAETKEPYGGYNQFPNCYRALFHWVKMRIRLKYDAGYSNTLRVTIAEPKTDKGSLGVTAISRPAGPFEEFNPKFWNVLWQRRFKTHTGNVPLVTAMTGVIGADTVNVTATGTREFQEKYLDVFFPINRVYRPETEDIARSSITEAMWYNTRSPEHAYLIVECDAGSGSLGGCDVIVHTDIKWTMLDNN